MLYFLQKCLWLFFEKSTRKKSPFSERLFTSFLTLGQIQFCIKIKQAQQLRQLLQVSF